MGVFNNLVMYKQDEPQNSMQSIVPDLATSWSWSEDGTELSFKLRQGVKWHDGKPFTAADVKCTFDLLLGKAKDKLRLNPRKAWYRNLDEVTAKADERRSFTCAGRSRPWSRCSPPGIRRFIPATCRRANCARIRSAQGPSNLSSSSRTSG
jgi:Bacterial extracellular solute-binding proteins, family 5 Middle